MKKQINIKNLNSIPEDKLFEFQKKIKNDIYGPGDDDYGRKKLFWKEKDKCVSCGKETEYTIDINIDYRKYYIEGAGQLCKKCYNKIYGKST